MPTFAEFDLGQFLGAGLETNQIYYLAGAIFLGLFGLSALRHAKHAAGLLPSIWIAIAIALFAGCGLLVARGFPEIVPESVKPWTEPNRLVRAGAALALFGAALVMLSGHWVRGALARWFCRVVGLCLAGLAFWLAVGWFANDLPAEVQPWAADTVIARAVCVLALACLGLAFWVRETHGSVHVRWINRAMVPAALGLAVALAWRWFGASLAPDVDAANYEPIAIVVVVVATGTCLLIAVGAYLLRDRPAKPPREEVAKPAAARRAAPNRPLPVAVLLDDRGRPVLPVAAKSAHGRAGPAGA